MVDVDHCHRQILARAPGGRHGTLRRTGEGAAVGQAGEFVHQREALQRLAQRDRRHGTAQALQRGLELGRDTFDPALVTPTLGARRGQRHADQCDHSFHRDQRCAKRDVGRVGRAVPAGNAVAAPLRDVRATHAQAPAVMLVQGFRWRTLTEALRRRVQGHALFRCQRGIDADVRQRIHPLEEAAGDFQRLFMRDTALQQFYAFGGQRADGLVAVQFLNPLGQRLIHALLLVETRPRLLLLQPLGDVLRHAEEADDMARRIAFAKNPHQQMPGAAVGVHDPVLELTGDIGVGARADIGQGLAHERGILRMNEAIGIVAGRHHMAAQRRGRGAENLQEGVAEGEAIGVHRVFPMACARHLQRKPELRGGAPQEPLAFHALGDITQDAREAGLAGERDGGHG